MTDQDIQQALCHLRKADPVMRQVIRKASPFTMRLRRNRFQALVFSILAQQISSKAAASIRARLIEYLKPEEISANTISRLSAGELRGIGVSRPKSRYLSDLANQVASRQLRLDRLARLPDEDVIAALIQVRGIGLWTAQMFLIFSLGRLDVFPHDDLGVRVALRKLYDLKELPDKEIGHRIAQAWRPYASVASWYCWRSLEFKD
jgi:DNA-3-methyladenine glycosylase II